MLKSSIIRPGLLVALRTSIKGGVSYQRIDLDAGTPVMEGVTVARWETTREVRDAVEHERAVKARTTVRNLIVRECAHSAFGLLCAEANAEKLEAGIAEAQRVAQEFNDTAQHTRIDIAVLTGRVADSDVQAAQAIGAEVRELIDAMQDGIKSADPTAIRDAASRARALTEMLSSDTAEAVRGAVEQARKAAREIVKRVEKAGETAAQVVSELKLEALERARFAVLDIDMPEAAQEAQHEAEAVVFSPAIDFAPEDEQQADAPRSLPPSQAPAFELE